MGFNKTFKSLNHFIERGFFMKRTLLMLFGVGIVGLGVFFYTAFYGIPWKKASTAKQLEEYVEKKYAIDVSVKSKYYNFKSDSYGATFVLDENTALSFEAEKITNGEIFDYYPEAVWVEEAKNDIYPVLNKSFPSFSVSTTSINPVYGIGSELNVKENVPSYKDVYTGIDLGIHFNELWTKENEEIILKESFEFISSLQKSGVKNLGIRLYFKDKDVPEQKTKTFSISIEGNDLMKIEKEEDVQKYINIF